MFKPLDFPNLEKGEKTDHMHETLGTAEKKQLYLFPFAGASFYSYNGLIKEMASPGLTIKTLELPGRGKKAKAPLFI